MYKQLTQILTAARLISRPQGATIKELQERVGITRRSVYRLLESLEELGYTSYDELDGRERRIKLNEERDRLRWWVPVPTVKFDFEDCVMLDYLFFEAAKSPALSQSVAKLRNKISSLVAEGGYALANTGGEAGARPLVKSKPVLLNSASLNKIQRPENAEHLKIIMQSIKEQSVCLVSYEAIGSGSCRTYKIHPLAIFEHNGGIYLFVLVPYYDNIRILSVERIKSIELTEEEFTPPEGFDAEKQLSDPFGIILTDPFTAKVWFCEQQAPYIRELDWPKDDSSIVEGENGGIVLSVKTGGAYELKRWVMSFGSGAELLEPDFLREEIAEELADASSYYGE